jgi:hypothetical protein
VTERRRTSGRRLKRRRRWRTDFSTLPPRRASGPPRRRTAGSAPGALAIVAGLAIGKPLGVFLTAAAAVRAGIAVKPAEYTRRQLAGAGALAGIGFTMSLFIAGQAFPSASDFSAAKIAVFAASILSAVVGTALLWGASRQELIEEAPQGVGMHRLTIAVRTKIPKIGRWCRSWLEPSKFRIGANFPVKSSDD